MQLPRLVIGGTQSGVGKTTISIGIMLAMTKRGLSVQPYKVGPDYIDSAFHTFVTGNKSRNLDSWMLDKEVINEIFIKNSSQKDISIIEGVMGFYDGYGIEKDMGSTAHVSKILQSPVILVIDGKGISSSAAAQVLGYKLYDKDVNIKGIIINNVSGERHYELLKRAIEEYTGIKCVGYLNKNINIELGSRHLGLIPSIELTNLNKKLEELVTMIEKTIEIDNLIEISKKAPKIDNICKNEFKLIYEKVNIGIALDKAFNFYYQDNLDLLKEMGANLIYFSPLKDKNLPQNLHGIYIGGGFPEVFAKELEKNKEMTYEIKSASDKGMPIYAECGGLMYLCKSIIDFEGKNYEMVGIFNAKARMTKRLQRFGYVYVNIKRTCSIASKSVRIKAHEFHRSILEETACCEYVYQVNKIREGKIEKRWQCGLVKNNTLAAYPHIHFYSNKELAKDFIYSCKRFKEKEV